MKRIRFKNRGKLTAAVVTCAVLAGSAAGVTAAVRKTTGGDQRVLVVPVSDLSGGWWSSAGSASGVADDGTTQKIYAGGTETIGAVRVKEGDAVKKGDVLLTYDATGTSLNLEKEKLDQQTIRLRIETAEKNLATLSKIRPTGKATEPERVDPAETDGDGGSETDGEQDGAEGNGNSEIPDGNGRTGGKTDPDGNPGEKDNPGGSEETGGKSVLAGRAVLNRSLTADAAYFWREGGGSAAGSEGNPYRFLVAEGAPVDSGFIRLLKGLKKDSDGNAYFLLEIREGGSPAGKLIRIWAQNASDLADVEETWTSEIPKNGSFILPEKVKTEDPQQGGGSGSGNQPGSGSGSGENPGGSTDPGNQPDGSSDPGGNPDGGSGSDKNPGSGNASSASLASFPVVLTAVSSPSDAASSADGTASSDGSGSKGADDPADSISGGSVTLIPQDAQYTKEELADAKKEQQDTLRDLRLDYRESELKVRRAEQALADRDVKAAFDGTVRKAGDPKNPPKDGSPLIEVAAASGMTVRGGLSEDQYSLVKTGDTVTVQSYMSGTTCEAEITSISPYPDTTNQFGDSSQTWYPFTAVIQDNSAEIGEGEWLDLSFEAPEDAGDSAPLMLDRAFVRTDEGSPYVYADENGTLKKRSVQLGKLSGGMYEILSGLTEEDSIAFPYGRNTKDGAKTKQGTAEQIYSS
ncbi:MAG: efflux RND transporter periplasmic adaptor subunit [Lachnospiraceae bacterium]|jgi:multidrug efflux pump subunit AcrA (membrane-fusion protein)|nr:efflux RND transporter periplasmic adaptor subunit [Lachnospiraceae bacterium]MCI1327554.1 efflux RND transporter periplasmic adaptor subunit [Lachnospiraceae bacterium]